MDNNLSRLPDEELNRLIAEAEIRRQQNQIKYDAEACKNNYYNRLDFYLTKARKAAKTDAKYQDIVKEIRKEMMECINITIPTTDLPAFIESMKEKTQAVEKKYAFLI